LPSSGNYQTQCKDKRLNGNSGSKRMILKTIQSQTSAKESTLRKTSDLWFKCVSFEQSEKIEPKFLPSSLLRRSLEANSLTLSPIHQNKSGLNPQASSLCCIYYPPEPILRLQSRNLQRRRRSILVKLCPWEKVKTKSLEKPVTIKDNKEDGSSCTIATWESSSCKNYLIS